MAWRSSAVALICIFAILQVARCSGIVAPNRGEVAQQAQEAATPHQQGSMGRVRGITPVLPARRLLQQTGLGAGNGLWFLGDDGSNYTLYGFKALEGAAWVLANYPANGVESKVNCSRLGLEQPDMTKPLDLFAVQYLSAGFLTWVKSSQGQTCTRVENGEVDGPTYYHPCDARRQFICVQRPNRKACGKGGAMCAPEACCGGTTCCCGSATCCDKTVCCHQGTKCCPKKGTRAAYCQNPFASC